MTGGYLFHRRVAERTDRHGARVEFVSIRDLPLPWAMATGPGWLRHPAIRDADAVVLDSIAAAAAAPWLARVRAPIVGMLHQPPGGIEGGAVARSARAPFDRWAYRNATVLMVASDWLAQQLTDAGIPRRRLRVVPPGKDVRTDPSPTQHGAPLAADRERLRRGRRIAALCVANWLPRKGIVELVEAVARLPRDLVTLHMVGDAYADRRYADRVHRRLAVGDLHDRVLLHGVLDPAVLATMYAAVDAFVLPSFEEPYGTVWGEAMAAGLPVVGWRAGNLPFLADDGREALLVPAGDVPRLAAAVERLALDADLRQRLGEAAARRAANRPTWDQTAERFFAVIADVVSHHRAAAPTAR